MKTYLDDIARMFVENNNNKTRDSGTVVVFNRTNPLKLS